MADETVEATLMDWVEPEIVEMSAQCSAALAVGPNSDGAPGVAYHRS